MVIKTKVSGGEILSFHFRCSRGVKPRGQARKEIKRLQKSLGTRARILYARLLIRFAFVFSTSKLHEIIREGRRDFLGKTTLPSYFHVVKARFIEGHQLTLQVDNTAR